MTAHLQLERVVVVVAGREIVPEDRPSSRVRLGRCATVYEEGGDVHDDEDDAPGSSDMDLSESA